MSIVHKQETGNLLQTGRSLKHEDTAQAESRDTLAVSGEPRHDRGEIDS